MLPSSFDMEGPVGLISLLESFETTRCEQISLVPYRNGVREAKGRIYGKWKFIGFC